MALLGQAGVLFLVGLLATVGVYGVVAAIIKMDDFGFFLKQKYYDNKTIVSFGNWLVNSMPKLMTLLGWIGAFAMLTVAGGILTHSFHSLSELGVKTLNLVSPLSSLIPGLTPTLEFISPMAPAAVLGITTVLVLNNIFKPIYLKIKK
jgi:predicted DNA repair protein MutK